MTKNKKINELKKKNKNNRALMIIKIIIQKDYKRQKIIKKKINFILIMIQL